MNRDEYFSRQRALVKSQARAEYRQAVLIRRAHREFYASLIAAVSKGENPEIDKQALAQRIEAIIRSESVKPAEEAQTLQAEMEASIMEELGIKPAQIRNHNSKQTVKNDGESRKGRQSFRPVKVMGQGWAVRYSPKQGISAYRRDPETGKIIWDTTPLTWLFAKRYDLSTSVWKAVEEEERSIFSIVRTGRALGRDVKDIAKDLETYIDYGDGGKRVMARWNHMFPNTEQGRREAWKRQYLADHPGPDGQPYQMFTEEARAALRDPEAQAYIKEKMAAKTRIGTPLRPDVVKEYHGRLGAAGIDYRTMRIMRTETAAALNDRQADIARNSYICTGEVDWVLQKGRDGWGCECAAHAAGSPYDVDNLPGPIPLHPNCVKKGTRILTVRGYKKIENLNPGDFVISHDGTANQITAIYKTEYHGGMIRLNNGPWTTLEHGFLTGDSWIAAQSFNKGDNITAVTGNNRDGILASSLIPHDCPTKGLKEGSFIIVLGNFCQAGCMPLSAIYFNGELYIGICEVDVIFSYCESGEWGITEIEKFCKKHFFIKTVDMSCPTSCCTHKTIIGSFHSLNSLMRRINACLKPGRIKPSSCLFYSRGNNTNGNKLPIDTTTRDSQNPRNGVYRQAIFFKKESQSFKVDISFDTHAKIISKKHKQYKGDIFDLTVSTVNSYIANGVVVHNCNCQLRPHLKPRAQIEAEFMRSTAADAEIIKQWREQEIAQPTG